MSWRQGTRECGHAAVEYEQARIAEPGQTTPAGTTAQGTHMETANRSDPEKIKQIAWMFKQTLANQQIIIRNRQASQPPQISSQGSTRNVGTPTIVPNGTEKTPFVINTAREIENRPLGINVDTTDQG